MMTKDPIGMNAESKSDSSSDEPPASTEFRVRALLRTVHRWLGLTLGILFATAGVSGSLLIFQPQFFKWAHGEMIPAGLSQTQGSIDDWVQNARVAVPDLQGPVIVWPPHIDHNISDAGMLLFAGRKPGGFGNSGFAAVLVAPETGKVLGIFDVDRSPAFAPVFFHARLWGGTMGGLIVGVTGVAALGLALLGLYIWWPRNVTLMGKLSPRPWRGTFLRAARLHQWVGIWMVPFLLVLAGTGVFLSQPAWVAPVLDIVVGTRSESEREDGPSRAADAACGSALGFDGALAQARALVPGSHFVSISPYGRGTPGRWLIIMRADSEAAFSKTHLIADFECGTVSVWDKPVGRSPRMATELWLASLHDGTAFGPLGSAIVTLLGLVPLLLAWSGVRMWLRRRRVSKGSVQP